MSSPTSVTISNKPPVPQKSNNTPQDHQIRARLLHKLGIYNTTTTISHSGSRGSPPSDIGHTSTSLSSSSSSPVSLQKHHRSLSCSNLNHSSSSTTTGNVIVTKQPPLTAAELRRDRILRGMGVGYTLKTLPPDGGYTASRRNPLQGIKPITEPLKATYNDDQDDTPTTTTNGMSSTSSSADSHGSSSSSNPTTTTTRRKTRIMFQEDVEVVPIPTRYEYSDRIKSRIWSNRHELQENAERNAIEFASEGWNWRNVTEDDGMYICSQSGELVHPIHLKHLTIDHNNDSVNHHDTNCGQDDDDDENNDEQNDSHTNNNGLTRGKPVDRNC